MSISALQTSDSDSQRQELTSVDQRFTQPPGDGFDQWLGWLQGLLKAHSLMLYGVDTGSTHLQLHPVGGFPESDLTNSSAHLKIAMRCAKECAVLKASSDTRVAHSVVCIPDVDCGNSGARYVLVIERRIKTKLDPQTQAKLVLWAFTCLEKFSTDRGQLPQASHLSRWSLAEIDQAEPLPVVLARLMNQLVTISGSERCLIAKMVVKNEKVSRAKLIAVSGQQRIDGRLPASESLVLAIENSYRNKELPLCMDHQQNSAASVAIEVSIANSLEQCARLIIPVCSCELWYAICLERPTSKPFGKTEQNSLAHDVGLALPLLLLSNSQGRGVLAACKRLFSRYYRRMVAHVPATSAAGAVMVAALLFLLLPVEYRVSAPLSVEASEKHVLIAPIDGFVESVAVKAGDVVVKGQELASLDDLDLQLQQEKLASEARQNQQAYAKALALHDRVEVTRLKEEASVMQTELSQLALQRDRMVLVAPVDGVVLSGSWDDFLGAAVSMGDPLFTLGSTNSHRLVLDVSEYDVQRVKPGQAVGIRMSADPSNVLLGSVTAIMPLAVPVDGINSVQVHASLNKDAQLRPGMQGLGKVLVGRQARLGQWMSRMTARLVWLGWRLGVLK